jgi:hypothetical protein
MPTHKTVHVSIDIRGVLEWSNNRLDGFLRDRDSRRLLTADEVRAALQDELAKGHSLIPWGNCEGFDFREGCPGHPVPGVVELMPDVPSESAQQMQQAAKR